MANKHGIGPKLLKNWWRKLQVFQIWIKSRCQLWKSSVWKFKGPETSTGMFKGRVTLDDSLSGEGDLFSSMNRVFWLRSAGRLNKRLPMLSASTSAFVAQLRAKKKTWLATIPQDILNRPTFWWTGSYSMMASKDTGRAGHYCLWQLGISKPMAWEEPEVEPHTALHSYNPSIIWHPQPFILLKTQLRHYLEQSAKGPGANNGTWL